MSATPDSTLADPQRIIADLQRQLAECRAERDKALAERDKAQRRLAERTAERDEALEQQTATAEVLQIINSSPSDLTPVFDAMLEKAIRFCGGVRGVLWTIDGEHGHLAAARGFSAEFIALLRQRGESGTHPALQRIIGGQRLIEFSDVAESELYRSGDPLAKAAVEAGVRSLIWVALVGEGVVIGTFAIGRSEVGAFSDKQIALLQNFAAPAVIAMENARLLTATREALDQQTATAEVLQVINSSPGDLTPVFEVMLDRAIRLCEAAYGVLWTYNGAGFRAATLHGVPQPYAASLSQEPTQFARGTNTALGQIAEGSDFAHFDDVATEGGYMISGARRLIELGGARTVMVVALRKDGKLLGAISAFRQEVRPFADQQIALLRNFAAQAVIAMENARLITETREALEQQTATAEVLGVINSSPGDLAPVFDAMLEKAVRLCDAAFGILWTYDGDHFHAARLRDVTPAFAEFLREPMRPVPGGTFSRLLAGEPVAEAVDIAGSDSYRDGTSRLRRAFFDLGGAQTALFVALRKDQTLLGAFTIYRKEVRPFTGKQTALVTSFAAQAVIAMENARLMTETREALEQQTATAEVLQVVNSSPGNLAPVFDAILEKAGTLCGIAFGSLQLYANGFFRAVAVRGVANSLANVLREPLEPGPESPPARLLAGERFVQIDVLESAKEHPDNPRAQASAAHGLRTVLFVPLRKDADLVGYIGVFRREARPFSEKEIALLENFAAQAVIAMENARLLGELRQRTEEVAELNRGLEARVAEQVDELGRVGRLKRFLAPQLAELIVSQGDEKILESHRREIVVVFCDLRGYTAFTETAEPEEVLDFLREYHGALGPLVSQYEGTLDQFSGDGIMVFFNDPVPCPNPAERAVKMAMAMREEAGKLIVTWRRDGCELGFGAGIAQGYATLGQIGFSERSGYTAIGTVCNLAARLCAEAKDGQILISSRVARAVEAVARLEDLGNLELKGLRRPVAAFNVVQSTSPAEPRPNLTVVANGPGV